MWYLYHFWVAKSRALARAAVLFSLVFLGIRGASINRLLCRSPGRSRDRTNNSGRYVGVDRVDGIAKRFDKFGKAEKLVKRHADTWSPHVGWRATTPLRFVSSFRNARSATLNKNSFEDFEFHELGEGRRSQINDAVTASRFAYGEDNRAERAVTALRISKLLLSST